MTTNGLEDLFWACVGGMFGTVFGVALVAVAIGRRKKPE